MKTKYQLRIELLSDMCVSDGGVYNSVLDTDICHDCFGFPYIPAKRLKGCLRECAVELAEWDDESKSVTSLLTELFGTTDKCARLRIENAYLENYDQYMKIAKDNQHNLILHPQNILNHFSYIRTQTAIDYETGTADENSLRTMRVANKGLIFFANLFLEYTDDQKKEQYFKLLQDCCRILKHIGVSRTRGLGEIRTEIKEIDGTIEGTYKEQDHFAELIPGSTRMDYEIEVLEPVICKSTNAGEADTLDYIEGSKILGIIAQRLKEEGKKYLDLINMGKLICSNAYLCVDGKRSTEIPGYVYSIKNEDTEYVNKLYETEERGKRYKDRQLNQIKHGYAVIGKKTINKKSVDVENHYHHRRPDDKSIGRASSIEGDGDADFYQMSSISKSQKFLGFITGEPEQISRIFELFSKENLAYIGYASSSEYGKVKISITNPSEGRTEKDEILKGKDFVVVLNAPTIVYSDKAMATSDPDGLKEEILTAIGHKGSECKTEYYMKYVTIGGYNTTWRMRKPTISAFDKGTAIAFHFEESVSVKEKQIFIGERTSEGFGEALINVFDPREDNYTLKSENPDENECANIKLDVSNNSFLMDICNDLLEDYIKSEAVKNTSEDFESADTKQKSTISNMTLMLNEKGMSMKKLKESIKDRFEKKSETKQEKLDYSNPIIEKVEKNTSDMGERFIKKYNICGYLPDIDFIQMTYLKTYLMHGKYMLRKEER